MPALTLNGLSKGFFVAARAASFSVIRMGLHFDQYA